MLRVFNNTARYVDQGGNKVHLVFFKYPRRVNVFFTEYFHNEYHYLFLLSIVEAWRLCHLFRAVARRYIRVFGIEEKHWEGRTTCSRSVLRIVDPRSFHETRGRRWNVEPYVSR